MRMINFIYPILSGGCMVLIYLAIIIRRKQKLANLENLKDSQLAQQKIYDENEKFWWMLGMTIVMITYIVLVMSLSDVSSPGRFVEQLLFGIIIWGVLFLIGKKLMPDKMYK